MTPVNVFNRSLIGHPLCERERSVQNRGWSFGPEESQQRPGQKQDHVKSASKKMRFNHGSNVRFHFACAQVEQASFNQAASKMSRLFGCPQLNASSKSLDASHQEAPRIDTAAAMVRLSI
jgi:hypothetical protein